MTDQPAPADLPRAIALEGASNLRDLGGWPTRDGRRVAFGKVFRSAALARLTDADRAVLADLGLRAVCDFRGTTERSMAPSRLGGLKGLEIHSLPIEPSIGASLTDILATRAATGEDIVSLLHRAYRAYAMDWSHRYRFMIDLILDHDGLPLLFHCSAGKDRTGFGASLLLTALGVPWEHVLADYMATNRLWRSDSELARDLPPHLAETLLSVHAVLLEQAYAEIRARFGSEDRFLAEALGLDATRRDRLRALLLD